MDVRTVRGKLLTTVGLIAIAELSEGKSLVWNMAAAPFHEFDKWLEFEHARFRGRLQSEDGFLAEGARRGGEGDCESR